MNNILLATMIFCLFICFLLYGQDKNEYAHNPLTPGYGISNYFELMPGKVINKNSIRNSQLHSIKEKLSLKLIRNKLYLSIKEYDGREQPKMSIYTISGRLVYRFNSEQNRSHSAIYFLSLPKLSKGVYLANVSYKNDQIQMKIIYTGK